MDKSLSIEYYWIRSTEYQSALLHNDVTLLLYLVVTQKDHTYQANACCYHLHDYQSVAVHRQRTQKPSCLFSWHLKPNVTTLPLLSEYILLFTVGICEPVWYTL